MRTVRTTSTSASNVLMNLSCSEIVMGSSMLPDSSQNQLTRRREPLGNWRLACVFHNQGGRGGDAPRDARAGHGIRRLPMCAARTLHRRQ